MGKQAAWFRAALGFALSGILMVLLGFMTPSRGFPNMGPVILFVLGFVLLVVAVTLAFVGLARGIVRDGMVATSTPAPPPSPRQPR